MCELWLLFCCVVLHHRVLLLSHLGSYLYLFLGEWEISAFDGSLKSRGMSIQYTIRHCSNGDLPLVDHDRDEDISFYIDQLDLQPRGTRPQNNRVLVRVCKNNTQSLNKSIQIVADDKTTEAERQSGCQLREVTLRPQGGEEPTTVSEEGIPQYVLEEIEKGGEWTVSHNKTEHEGERGVRERRHAKEGNGTDVDVSSGDSEDGGTGIEVQQRAVGNWTDTGAEIKAEERYKRSGVNSGTTDLEDRDKILLDMDRNHIQSEPENRKGDPLYLKNNNTANLGLSFEYDDYSQGVLFSVCLLYISYIISYVDSKCHESKHSLPFPTKNTTFCLRRTAHQIYLARITWTCAPERSDIATTTLLQRRSPGTTVLENHISSSNPGRNNSSSCSPLLLWKTSLS